MSKASGVSMTSKLFKMNILLKKVAMNFSRTRKDVSKYSHKEESDSMNTEKLSTTDPAGTFQTALSFSVQAFSWWRK